MNYDVLSDAVILNDVQLHALQLGERHREWPLQGISGLLVEADHARHLPEASAFDRLVLDELETQALPFIVRAIPRQTKQAKR